MHHSGLLFLWLTLACCHRPSEPSVDSDVQVFTYTHQFTNVHFVARGDRLLMVDAGLPGDLDGVLAFMADNELSPAAIDYIVLTHGHPDHAGNAAAFQERFGNKIIAGKGELNIIANRGADSLCARGFAGHLIASSIGQQRYASFQPDVLVADSLDLSSLGWPAILRTYTSHTPGSLVLFIDNYAFVGDLIKGQNLRKRHPAFHLIMCDLEANLADLRSVLRHEEATTWYLGHFGPLARDRVVEFVHKESTKQTTE